MRFLYHGSNGQWLDLSSGPSDISEQELEERREQFVALVRILLTMENLVVLCGLGTTIYIKENESNPHPAPTMESLWASVEEGYPGLEKIIEAVGYQSPTDGNNIELLLSRCHLAQMLNPDETVQDFIEFAEHTIAEQCRFVKPDTDLHLHEAFLRKVARRSTRLPRLRIFTTNYDLCFEEAAARTGFTLIDGFSRYSPQQFDANYFRYDLVTRDGLEFEFVQNVAQLYKLHGSVDWQRYGNRVLRVMEPKRPLLIYPRFTKFEASYEPPFLELMSSFQSTLRSRNVGLLIVGFGFNDPHIAQPVLSAIHTNVSLRAMIVAPEVENTTNPVLQSVRDLIQQGDPRLTMAAMRFEDLVPLIPDLVPQTELEMHDTRAKRTD